LGARIVYEVRDTLRYGRRGRSYANLSHRYASRGLIGEGLQEALIAGATHPNQGISSAAVRGARYLRYGGRVVLVISVVSTAYVLLTTPEEELGRVLFEEGGAAIGGAVGSGLAIGLCLVFGVASGGWGLLACGALGGIAGGVGGTFAGNRSYYATSAVDRVAVDTGAIPVELLSTTPLACY
jgi:hypothetical protein